MNILNKSLLLIVFLGVFEFTFASFGDQSIGARQAGMGFASVTLNDFWSISNNQAGMTSIQKFHAGFYFENRFLVKELSTKAGALILPTKSGVFGLSTKYFGFNKYNETKFGLAYAKKLSKRISVGVQFDYLSVHITEPYGKRGRVTFEIGCLTKLSEEFTLGVHLFNPVAVKLNDYANERIPTIMKVGLAYHFHEIITINTELEKDLNFRPIFKAGMEYQPVKDIYLRVGVKTNPASFTLGFGFVQKKIRMDIASVYHSVLGFSPQISMVYGF